MRCLSIDCIPSARDPDRTFLPHADPSMVDPASMMGVVVAATRTPMGPTPGAALVMVPQRISEKTQAHRRSAAMDFMRTLH
jgi:hypothetical protein